MKLAIVAFSDKQEFRLQIKKEMVRRGHVCDLYYFPVLEIDENVVDKTFDTLSQYEVVHFVLGFNKEITKELQERLIEAGVKCPNRMTNLTDLNNKIMQMVILTRNGVAVPKSIRLMNPDKAEVSKLLKFPFVVKEPVGSKGEQVALCTEDNFSEVVAKNKEYLAQEFIEYTADYRIHVAGDKTFCTYERIAPEGDFRANVSLGGAMKKVEDSALLSRLSELALQTAKVLSVDYGGVDIISDKDGNLFVLEFNPNPGFKNVLEVTGTPFYEPVASYYESLME
ncbi:MAG: ATP-grasp domain-containing protein [Candidatus Paceibacterota bacterium]